MKKILMLFLCSSGILFSQYHPYHEFTNSLKNLASKNSSFIKLISIAKTIKGNDLWAVTIGKNENNKAILVIGGIQSTQVVGSEYALRFIQTITGIYGKVDSITQLLDNTTIYVIPRANPDATESIFKKPLFERETNFTPYDDDRDDKIDEDDVEDLNNDGIISWMRIKDSRGEWIINPDEPRLMKKADPARGEKGIYRLLSEGIDNDNDEEWNEDAPGGTDFNRNFTFNYKFFGKNSGVNQISETETKAIADFVFDHPNIAVVFTFSDNDNLTTAWKNEPPKGDSPFITSVIKEDEDYFGNVSKKFLEITTLKEAPKTVKGEGSLSEWAYYHAGRWSFSVRPWWVNEIQKPKDSSVAVDSLKKDSPKKNEKIKSDDWESKTLQWYDAIGKNDIFVEWKKFKHPDFSDQEVEIGGVRPFVLSNPPADSLNSFSKPYSNFITYLAQQLPSVSLSNQKVEKIGDNVYRLSIDVVNNGYLPTNSAMGVKTRWVRNVRVVLDMGKENQISSGKAKQILDPIQGSGGYKTVNWVIVGKGEIKISAESPVAGKSEMKIVMK